MPNFECHLGGDIWSSEHESINKNVCKGLPEYAEYEGEKYCVLHYPGDEKKDDFKKVWDMRTSLQMTDFRGIYFPADLDLAGVVFEEWSNFRFAIFSKAADFSNSEFLKGGSFYDATFLGKADFSRATFSEDMDFNDVLFKGAVDFEEAIFSGETNFYRTFFLENVDFISVKFKDQSKTDFTGVSFHKTADFSSSKVYGHLNINGFWKSDFFPSYGKSKFFSIALQKPESSLILRDIQLPTPKKLSLNSVRMKPSWLVNTNFGDTEFTNISWDDINGTSEEIERELKALMFEYGVQYTHNLLTVTYRKLSENCAKNQDFENASNFRRLAFVAEKKLRKQKMKEWQSNLLKIGQDKILCKDAASEVPNKYTELKRWIKGSPTNVLHFFYGLLSGYGEKWFRAFGVLITIWISFAVFYYLFGSFENNSLTGVGDYIGYSLQVITLQRPEPKALGWTRLLCGLESLLGPTQLALLALAIRRRFMS